MPKNYEIYDNYRHKSKNIIYHEYIYRNTVKKNSRKIENLAEFNKIDNFNNNNNDRKKSKRKQKQEDSTLLTTYMISLINFYNYLIRIKKTILLNLLFFYIIFELIKLPFFFFLSFCHNNINYLYSRISSSSSSSNSYEKNSELDNVNKYLNNIYEIYSKIRHRKYISSSTSNSDPFISEPSKIKTIKNNSILITVKNSRLKLNSNFYIIYFNYWLLFLNICLVFLNY